MKHSVNKLLRRNLEIPARTEQRQHLNPNFYLYQQQPNFSLFQLHIEIRQGIDKTQTLL